MVGQNYPACARPVGWRGEYYIDERKIAAMDWDNRVGMRLYCHYCHKSETWYLTDVNDWPKVSKAWAKKHEHRRNEVCKEPVL